jgi:hypothetical protein
VLAGNAYFRRISTSGVNSNVNDDYDPPEQSNEAVNLRTAETTRGWGASLQLTLQRTTAGIAHQLVFGAAYDAGTTDFAQSGQTATFVADRETIGTGEFSLATDVTTSNRSFGFYVSDTIAIAPQWSPAGGAVQRGAHRHAGPDRRVAGRQRPTRSVVSIRGRADMDRRS